VVFELTVSKAGIVLDPCLSDRNWVCKVCSPAGFLGSSGATWTTLGPLRCGAGYMSLDRGLIQQAGA
jgi:hypothetical protein